MRYIDIQAVVDSIPEEIRDTLQAVDDAMSSKSDEDKESTASNGNSRWRPTKPYLERASHRKCWYTESKNSGSLYDVDHFRPKAKILNRDGSIKHWYWFLAFNPINYRLSSQISNRLNTNPDSGHTGGKGKHFPLMEGSSCATDVGELDQECPVILDPCVEADTVLLAFQADGRPVVSAHYTDNQDAKYRVEKSKLLLNLDYPTFNEDREHLYNKIRKYIERGDRYAAEGNSALEDVKDDLRDVMKPEAEYSKAAECYVRCFRDRTWVEELILE